MRTTEKSSGPGISKLIYVLIGVAVLAVGIWLWRRTTSGDAALRVETAVARDATVTCPNCKYAGALTTFTTSGNAKMAMCPQCKKQVQLGMLQKQIEKTVP